MSLVDDGCLIGGIVSLRSWTIIWNGRDKMKLVTKMIVDVIPFQLIIKYCRPKLAQFRCDKSFS